MKKISVLTITLLLLVSLCFPVYATDTTTKAADTAISKDDGVKFTYIYSTDTSLEISSSGYATIENSLSCSSSVDKIRISCYLQRYENGNWITLNHWYKNSENNACTLIKGRYVTSGYTYRVKSYFYAYVGDNSDSDIKTTTEYY